MFDFHEKRKIRSFLYSKTFVLIIFLVSILLSISAYNRFSVAQEMKMKLETKRTELSELKQRANMLESKVNYLDNDRGVEEELRNRFDVAREGEQVIILLDPKDEKKKEATIVVPPSTTTTDKKGIRDFFSHLFNFE
ncbi:MAG: septum formation initiator family protein [Candidatus Pacebacteria bacterium]|nr:septum formation initiator family protein [Candidatus Paceibacterota bacterium]MCF7857578.1 septum formation initiator family protein [Candidatus Paceibacterota bacterium]